MKELYIIRHAKAQEQSRSGNDFDRELKKSGQRDAQRMGKLLASRLVHPDVIVSSAAPRALETARLITEQLMQETKLSVRDDLYLASPEVLIEVIRHFNRSIQCAFIVAHNPGVTYLVNELCDEGMSGMPTCGVAMLKVKSENWKAISKGCAELSDLMLP